MSIKKIKEILAPPPAHMVGDGFRVHSFFPGGSSYGNKVMSPFYMLDYNAKIEFAPRDIPRGVGVHPHRGFETVTIVYHGKVAHGDSVGNTGVIGQGEVQWMTAAAGILHKEYHEENFSQSGGLFQIVQLWVNLPAKDKMSSPKYQGITKEMMGSYHLRDNNGTVEIIAGTYKGIKGPAFTFTPIELYHLRLNKGAVTELDFPAEYNTGLLMIEGSIRINGSTIVPGDHFALFENEGQTFTLEAMEDALILVLSGQPINEPIASYGPFLMNTTEELQQAIKDFNTGKFGILAD